MQVEVTAVDHVYLTVSDLERAQRFYDRVMAVLGFRKVKRPLAGGDLHVHYFNRVTQLSLRPARGARAHDPYAPGLHHYCFGVADRAAVDAVAEALHERGIEASPPAPYPQYHADYYATFFEDPDGLRLEVVNHCQIRRDVVAQWDAIPPIEDGIEAEGDPASPQP